MKKPLSLMCLFIHIVLKSQNVMIDTIDEFNGARIIMTSPKEGKSARKSDYIDSNPGDITIGLSYYKMKDSTEIYKLDFHLFTNTEFGCFVEDQSSIILLFENAETMKLTQDSKTECEVKTSAFHSLRYAPSFNLLTKEQESSEVWRDLLKENIEFLQNNPIKKIRVISSEGKKDYDILPLKRNFLALHIKAIEKKIKGL